MGMTNERILDEIKDKASQINDLSDAIADLADAFALEEQEMLNTLKENDITDEGELDNLLHRARWYDEIANYIKANTPGGTTGINIDSRYVIDRLDDAKTKDILRQFAQLLEESK